MLLRHRLLEHYGDGSRLLAYRNAPAFGAHLFVVDTIRRTRPVRILGCIDHLGWLIEQSAMDRLRPDRLAFGYERLMMIAFALTPTPKKALLLGLGGGAMWRHLATYLPDCEVTIVERDPIVRELARKHFHIKRPVVMADAADVVRDSKGQFDVVLVDLYDSRGSTASGARFWRACVRALAPNGCLAVNWADFAGARRVDGEAAMLAHVAPRSFFIGERIREPNVVQYVPTMSRFRRTELSRRLKAFAQTHDLPRENRDILKRCRLLNHFVGDGDFDEDEFE
ncbi:MAG: methyltransferase domain-containing protein [Alphaproteobacteria bacterium]|nr:methyltransferase domain-containing protein [Alphaproteobacteria bacterium]